MGLSFSLSRVTWSVQWGALGTPSARVSRDISVSSDVFPPYCRLHHVWWKLLCRRRNCARNRGLCRFFNTNYQLLYSSSIMIILEQKSSQIYKSLFKDFLYHYMYSHSNEFHFYPKLIDLVRLTKSKRKIHLQACLALMSSSNEFQMTFLLICELWVFSPPWIKTVTIFNHTWLILTSSDHNLSHTNPS